MDIEQEIRLIGLVHFLYGYLSGAAKEHVGVTGSRVSYLVEKIEAEYPEVKGSRRPQVKISEGVYDV